jgi:predicted hotdog family 3-hydroxylacyl-ACP dehydratase
MKTLELIPSKLLPHKAPMLLIDEVLDTDFEKNITVKTTV